MKRQFNTIMTWTVNGTSVRIDKGEELYYAVGHDDVFRGIISASSLDGLYKELIDCMKLMKEHLPNKSLKEE